MAEWKTNNQAISQRAAKESILDQMGAEQRWELRFHWKFWEPLDCIGGRVRFGFYYRLYTRSKWPK